MSTTSQSIWKGVRAFVSVLLAVYMCMPVVAYADDDTSTGDSTEATETVEAKSVEGYVTVSNSPASQAAPEILGLTGIDELQLSSPSIDDQTNSLKYILMGTDEYNVNANPYYYNTIYDTDGTGVVFNTDKRRSNNTGGVSNPVRALAEYGTGDDTDDDVWEMLPDVIVGNQIDTAGTLVTYLEDPYAPAVEDALDLEDGSYEPIAVEYTLNSMADIVDKTYGIAEAGEQVVEESNGEKQLRYGSAVDIAVNYEKYVKGTQGYILEALDEGTVQEKSVVVVQAYADDQFTLLKTPDSWDTDTRFLEITTLVADNLADDLEGDSSVTVTREQLTAMDPDLIILMTDASDAEMGDLATKTYWAESNNSGAIYKVDANSVEIATNYGRILGCLYDELFDQADLVAYYYETFYHVKTDMVAQAIDYAMDGVRNWDVQEGSGDALLTWDEDTVEGYSQDEVQAMLDEGVAYLYSLGEEADELVQLTDYISFTDISSASVSAIDAQTYTGSAIEPAVTVTLDGTTLVEGTDYTVEYANNVEVGTATVTITGAGDYIGSLSASFEIVAAETEEGEGDGSEGEGEGGGESTEPDTDTDTDTDEGTGDGESTEPDTEEEEEAFEPYFTDVQDEGKYYYDAVYALADADIITGVSETLYGVGQDMTRAQFATILYRVAGSPDTSYDAGYADVVDGQYYTDAINWAAEEEVVTGYTNGKYGVNDELSFEDMCLIIARYANGGDSALQAAVSDSEAASILSAYADGDSVAAYADNGMAWCVTEGLVTGNTDGTIVPQEDVSRERAATVVARWQGLAD